MTIDELMQAYVEGRISDEEFDEAINKKKKV